MKNPSKFSVLSAAAACLALSLTACGSSAPEKSGADEATGSKPVTLTVGTFNEFGYEKLFDEYETLNPNVTIEHKKAATSQRSPRQPHHPAGRRIRPGRHRRRRGGLAARAAAVSRPLHRPERPRGRRPLAGLEDRGRDRPPTASCWATAPTPGPRPSATRRPVQEGGPAHRPRGGREAAGRHLGQLLRGRQEVQGRQPGSGVVRLRRRHLPGHDQPAGERLRGGRRHRHRDGQPEGQGHLQPGAERLRGRRPVGPPQPVERRLDRRLPDERASPRCCARAGCSASSRATPPESPAGTSPTSSPAAAATGAAPT